MSFSRVTSRSRVLGLITRMHPVDFESMLPSLCVQIHLKLDIFNRRPSKDAALEKFKLAMSSPITPSSSRLSHSTNDEMWTPSAMLALEESIEIQDFRPTRGNVQDPIQVFNACIDSLVDAVQKPRITYLESQVDCWEKCSFTEKSEFVQKAGEACQLVCDVIAEMVKRYSKQS